MKFLQPASDTCAVGFSLTCALHCLLTPVLVTMLPASVGVALEDEAFHLWLVLAVVPTSIVALAVGCRLHKRHSLIAFAVLGVGILVLPLLLGHERVSPGWEKTLTLIGSLVVATVHILNFRLCRSDCDCELEAEEAGA